jgi:hypothetical protein
MAAKKINGVRNVPVERDDDIRVTVDREEYSALRALKDRYEDSVIKDAKSANRNHDLLVTCDAQAKRLAEIDLILQHQDRVIGLQRVFIDMLRGNHPQIAALEDLSMFWRQWFITSENHLKNNPQQRTEAAKLEPDLFRSWKLWVRDADRGNRSFSVAGTREEINAEQQLISQDTLQEHVLDQARAHERMLAARVRELEAEVEAYKNARKSRASFSK